MDFPGQIGGTNGVFLNLRRTPQKVVSPAKAWVKTDRDYPPSGKRDPEQIKFQWERTEAFSWDP